MSRRDNLSENLRFLLWQRCGDHHKWISLLANELGTTTTRARQLLEGVPAEDDDLERIKHAFSVEPDEVLYGVLDSADADLILQRNLGSLLRGIPHGQKKTVAKEIGVDQSTLSKWETGKQRPVSRHQEAIVSFFSLPAGTDLTRDRLYLQMNPLTVDERRERLKQLLESAQPDVIADHYKSIERLLEQP